MATYDNLLTGEVDRAFRKFLDDLRTTPTETALAASHRASIKARLENDFGMTSFFRTGSFGNGTNISGFSDVDYFAVIPIEKLKADSSATLEQVAGELRARFPMTNVRVDSPGIKLPFGVDGANAVEVVPVDYTGQTKLDFPQYDMPDGRGGWMFSAPASHNAYVTAIDNRLRNKVKPLIRFVKAWKFIRRVPIRSFYIELAVAKYADEQQSILYDIDVKNVLHRLRNTQLAPLLDPRFPDDGRHIEACSTEPLRLDAMSRLQRASDWAEAAVSDNLNSRVKEAFERWRLVFDGQFPAYQNT